VKLVDDVSRLYQAVVTPPAKVQASPACSSEHGMFNSSVGLLPANHFVKALIRYSRFIVFEQNVNEVRRQLGDIAHRP
jgi:hypothetical protein